MAVSSPSGPFWLFTDIFFPEWCKELKNYNSVFHIISGLNHGLIQRLKSTRDKVPHKHRKVMEVSGKPATIWMVTWLYVMDGMVTSMVGMVIISSDFKGEWLMEILVI